MDRKICAVFGEKPDELGFGYDEEHYLCAQMKLGLVCAIKMMTEKGYRTFCSTAEQGSEMWASEACIAMKELGGDIELVTSVTDHVRADSWHPERRERYFGILTLSDEVNEPEDEPGGLDYIFEIADSAIIQGDVSKPRLAEIKRRAEENGLTVYCV